MPMITKPASIEKNSAAEITLDKSVLANIDSVSNDLYFGDSTNWSEVLIYFRSSEGNQREILKFDATQASPTANFLVSDKARDAFQVQKIVIKDFDNDSFTVTRSELVVADFDVTFSGGGSGNGGGGSGGGGVTPGGTLLTWSTGSSLYNQVIDDQSVQGAITLLSSVDNDVDGLADWVNTKSVEILSGNMLIQATVPDISKDVIFGFQNQETSNGPQNVAPIRYGFWILQSSLYFVIDINDTLAAISEAIPVSNGAILKIELLNDDVLQFYINNTLSGSLTISEANGAGFGITVPSGSYSVGVVIPSENAPVTLANILFENI